MLNRVFNCVWITCIALAASIYAAECKSISIYSPTNPTIGSITSSTFPEPPEWLTNWGIQGQMVPPYIRFSGQHNQLKTWESALSFPQLPLKVQGGYLELQVHASNQVLFNIALIENGVAGPKQSYKLSPNQTKQLKIPLSALSSKESLVIEGISIGLSQVPAYQYNTLFLVNISFSCAESTPEKPTTNEAELSFEFSFTETEAKKAERIIYDLESAPIGYALKKHSDSAQLVLKGMSISQVILTEKEHLILQKLVSEPSSSPKQSWKNWNQSLYYISQNRLSDSLFANPKTLFRQANEIAASYNYEVIPLLIGSFNYDYSVCEAENSESVCIKEHLENAQLLVAGLASSFAYRSNVELILDPYFITTNQNTIPEVEVLIKKEWKSIKPKSRLSLSFDSLGEQSISIRLRYGSKIVENTLLLEVR